MYDSLWEHFVISSLVSGKLYNFKLATLLRMNIFILQGSLWWQYVFKIIMQLGKRWLLYKNLIYKTLSEIHLSLNFIFSKLYQGAKWRHCLYMMCLPTENFISVWNNEMLPLPESVSIVRSKWYRKKNKFLSRTIYLSSKEQRNRSLNAVFSASLRCLRLSEDDRFWCSLFEF